MNPDLISSLAHVLDTAILESREIERLTLKHPDLSLDDAYLIQERGISLRQARGEKQIGFKMGLTSQAKREQMSLFSPIFGILTERMEVPDTAVFSMKGFIHPKIEPEIAFIVGREIRGPVSAEEAIESCSSVCAAMEILDSRYVGFKYFSLPDVVADNCSSASFVLSSERTSPKSLDLASLKMVMEVDGVPVARTLSNEISGHPIQSLVQLSEMLAKRGGHIPAGSIVLAGSAAQAVPLKVGAEVRLWVESLGSVSIRVG